MSRPCHKELPVLLILLLLALGGIPSPPAHAAPPSVKRVGSPLPAPVVSLFVPARSDDGLLAATGSQVYALQDDGLCWSPILGPEAGAHEARILDLQGAAKSPKSLYVAREDAVVITSNGGRTWRTSQPPAYAERGGSFVELAVNPEDSGELIVLRSSKAWISGNSGKAWKELTLPSTEPATAIGYADARNPQLVLATGNAVYKSADDGATWTTVLRDLAPHRLMQISREQPWALIHEPQAPLRLIDLERQHYQIELPLDSRLGEFQEMAMDSRGYGNVWLSNGGQLYFAGLRDLRKPPRLVAVAEGPIGQLVADPSNVGSVYLSHGNSVYYASTGDSPTAGGDAEALSSAHFELVGERTVADGGGEEPRPELARARTAMNGLLAAQPPLEEVIASALQLSKHDELDVERWKRNVRRSNLLPRLTVSAGVEQDARKVSDTRETVQDFNQYGVELTWDLGKLLFSTDEAVVSREGRDLAEWRNEVIEEVTDLYYERLKKMLKMQLHGGEMDEEALLSLELDIQRASQQLNQICGRPLFAI